MSADFEKQISTMQAEIELYKAIISEMTVPIINSVIPNTLLIPLNGHLFKERIDAIDKIIFEHISKHKNTRNIIMDFTGISAIHIELLANGQLSIALRDFNNTMNTLGIRTLYTGFQADVALNLIQSGFNESLEAFPTYKDAVNKLILHHSFEDLFT